MPKFTIFKINQLLKKMAVKIETKDITPVCPFCEKEVKKLIEVKRGMFKINRVFCCPHCNKIVGISAGAQ